MFAILSFGECVTLAVTVFSSGTATLIVRTLIKGLERRWKAERVEISDQFCNLLKIQMEASARRAGSKRTRVIDIEFLDRPAFLHVPVIRDEWLTVLPGVEIMGDEYRPDSTTYFLRVAQVAQIRQHRHRGSESVRVISGTMTDLNTGITYRAGEVWTIPAGEPHSVQFHAPHGGHGTVLITTRPALPSTTEQPLKLDDLAALT
jgi:anti-sigma factor ChrR (cupin superfamily)